MFPYPSRVGLDGISCVGRDGATALGSPDRLPERLDPKAWLGGESMPSQRFSRRYLAKHQRSEQLHKRARRSSPGGVESNIRWFKPHPLVVDYGNGGYVYDVDGNKILDFMMGFGSLLLGHNNRDIALEVIRQLESGSMLGLTTPLYGEYLEQIKGAFPSVKRVRLTNSGTEATMHAIRAARSYTGKEKIAKAEGAYHGVHDAVLQSVDMDARTARRMNGNFHTVPYGRGIPKALSELTTVFPFNDAEKTSEILEESAADLAAVIIEPVLCGPGVVVPKRNYLKHLRRAPRGDGHVNALGRWMFSGLQDLADDRRIPAWVEWVGSMGTVYFTTKDVIEDFRDALSASTRRWWNWFIHCLGNNVLFGIPNAGERAFICTEHTEEDIEWALEVADNAFAAIGKEARRHKEKVPTVQLQAVGEQAAVYGESPTPPSV